MIIAVRGVEIAEAVVFISAGGDIVGQRVNPDVNDVSGIEIHGNAPGKTGPGDAQILQTGINEIPHHFIYTALGL